MLDQKNEIEMSKDLNHAKASTTKSQRSITKANRQVFGRPHLYVVQRSTIAPKGILSKSNTEPKQLGFEESKEGRSTMASSLEDKALSDTDVSSQGSDAEVGNMKKMLMDTKVEGGKSAWATTLETLGMSDGGKKKKGDILCDSFAEAMKVFYELIQGKDWDFATTPFDDFNATKEQLFQAFVHWSRKSSDDGEASSYNPSKALRRLEAYVEWMNKNCKDMNLQGSTMKEAADNWKMKITHDKKGRLVWWIDIPSLDLKSLKQVPPEDTLRLFVWMSHMIVFDKGAQEHGLVLVEAMGKHTGLMETMTTVSMDVGTKLDRLTIGILPIKMEACFVYNNPTWLRVIMALMSPFMGAKMRKRIFVVPNKTEPQAYFEEELGKENFPTGISQLEGSVEKDMVAQTLERLAGKDVITDEIET
ncbi:expressed unknown protein [Seminavis robusta]|uniref:CRAL-TRIO domain-containing protein n=1 Tax=Seminavis robusta TaxID=568900 RepID=A0A9N8H6Y2_9STRA|nr:expressed unknown protein [Seminavis robusta]|eukprot:Sro185_g080300.1 n/a (418) ;mRNA; f:37946-39199